MPNDPKPPEPPRGYTTWLAYAMAILPKGTQSLARAEPAKLHADAEAYRSLCKHDIEAVRHIERDIEQDDGKRNELRKESNDEPT